MLNQYRGPNSGSSRSTSGEIPPLVQTRFRELSQKAEAGDTKAQCELGILYLGERGIPKDGKKAKHWFEKAALKNDGEGYRLLGDLYREGSTGIDKDEAKAKDCYKQAFALLDPKAKEGNKDALYGLGRLYRGGCGVARDTAKAIDCFRKAADQDHMRAKTQLSIIYHLGEGMQKPHLGNARLWAERAATQGHDAAQCRLGYYYHMGQGDLAINHTKAYYWYEKSAAQGYATAQYNLGLLYYEGKGVGQSQQTARIWLQKAADQGYVDAQNSLRRMSSSSSSSSTYSNTNRSDGVYDVDGVPFAVKSAATQRTHGR